MMLRHWSTATKCLSIYPKRCVLNVRRYLCSATSVKDDMSSYRKAAVSLRYQRNPSKANATCNDTSGSDKEDGKPPTIMLHGLLGCGRNFYTISKLLHSNDIILPDLRNHGSSPHTPDMPFQHMASDIVELMDTLNIPAANLIGHSLGGKVAMATAVMYPDRVSKLISIDMPNVDFSEVQHRALSSKGATQTRRLLDLLKPLLQEQSGLFSRKDVQEKLLKSAPRMQLQMCLFLLQNLRQNSNGEWYWRMNLQAIDQLLESQLLLWPRDIRHKQYFGPVLFVKGELSSWLLESDSAGIKSQFPGAQFKIAKGAGHWVHNDDPKQLAEYINTFINETRPNAYISTVQYSVANDS